MYRDAVLRFVLVGAIAILTAAGTGKPPANSSAQTPYFASLSSDKVYMREGPSYAHRVLWIYRRKGLPVEILAAFDVWRRVQDSRGTIGWVHGSMISDRRTVVVIGTVEVPLRRRPDRSSGTLALVQPGAIAKLQACNGDACQVLADDSEGWLDKKEIWGVRAGEIFN